MLQLSRLINRPVLVFTIAILSLTLVSLGFIAPSVASALQSTVDTRSTVPAIDLYGGFDREDPEPFEPLLLARAIPGDREIFSSGRTSIPLTVRGNPIPYRVMGISALPGEVIDIGVDDNRSRFHLRDENGRVEPHREAQWKWRVPAQASATSLLLASSSRESVHLNVFVLHPATTIRNGRLNGFQIGEYQAGHPSGDPAYIPPAGFIEVRKEDRDILVSPHFTLGQFLVKQQGEPSYLVLSKPLVVKLEAVLEAVNREGFDVPTFHVMSGFRTPYYNRSIGNRTVYSRHLWGDAADIFIDTNGDGRMDDLNGDGRIDRRDADVLRRIVEEVERVGGPGLKDGGIGVYPPNHNRGPFVHVDARGQRAAW